MTAVERTLLDVCGTTPPWVFNEAVDAAPRRNLVSLDRVADFLERERRSGVDGVQRLREAITVRSQETGTSRSTLERRFLSLLQKAGVPLPELNQEIRGPDGFCAIVDMVYAEPKVVIEIQSYAHHSSLHAFNSDAERLGILTATGYRTLEVTAEQIHKHPQRTIERVAVLLRRVSTSSKKSGEFVFLEEAAGDHRLLDLGRSLSDEEEGGVAVEAFDRELLRVAVAPVHPE